MSTPAASDPAADLEAGKQLRKRTPRRSHASWSPSAQRPDPVATITAQNDARLQFLVPIRHHRMAQTPFTFYRGAAALMAADLARTSSSGLHVQLCGDAHLSNFGVYGSPERDLVFDVNDFDETLPGPWEWDVKRLAASFAIAARNNDYGAGADHDLAQRSVAAYRSAMRDFAAARHIDVWYSHLDVEEVLAGFGDQIDKSARKRGERFVRKARARNSLRVYDRLTESTVAGRRITSQPPLIIPLRELPFDEHPAEVEARLLEEFDWYLSSLPDHVARLVRRYRYRDFALKVVGVGSVGTRCWIMLLEGRDERDPLFLQVKEAGPSVLEAHLPASWYAEQGRRVVEGQRLMQAVSDSFLGWHVAESGNHFYWRQFKDMKGSIEVDGAERAPMERYAGFCGWTLARAHARAGEPAVIAGYLGRGDNFDRAVADFAVAYADQNERDHAAFVEAIRSGRIPAHE